MDYRKIAGRQDKRVSKEMDLKIVTNSGAIPGKKGDLYGEDLLVETKTSISIKKSFSIKLAWLDKISQEAFSMGKTFWALFFCMGDQDDYVVIDSNTFNELYQSYLRLKEIEKI